MPYFSIAARVSPPPAIENAGLFAIAPASALVPPPKASNSKTPSGPFQMTVPAATTTSATTLADAGPMSRIISSAPTAAAGFVSAFAVAANSRATTTSVGIGMPTPRAFACESRRFATSTMSGSWRDLPTARPVAARKVLAMPPPTTSWSTLATRLSSTWSLVETFEPPTTATSGRLGSSSARPSASSSAASNGPAQATGAARATPCVLASARWAVPKASITNTSQSAAMRAASAGSSFFSPFRKRTFSSSTTSPGAAEAASSSPSCSRTGLPRIPERALATGASERAGSRSPSFGRPRCDITSTRAPLSAAARIVGAAARSRASLVTRPSAIGTLRSSRISTRLPASARSPMRIAFTWSLTGARPGERRVEHAVREAPFVVVPGADLHQRAFQHLGELGVDGARGRVVVEVHRNEWFFRVFEDAVQPALRSLREDVVHLGGRGRALRNEGEVHELDVDRRHAHREAVELAFQLRQHEADRGGGAGLGRDHGHRRRARAAQVRVVHVRQHLVVGVGVHGRPDAGHDAETLVQRLHQRGEAVRGAGRVRDDRHVLAQRVVIDAVDDGRVDAVRGCRDDDLLRPAREVLAGLLLVGKQAGALEHDIGPELAPGQLRRVALRQHADAVAVHHQVVAIHGDLAGERAMGRVVARQVRVGVRVTEVVDPDDADVASALALVQRAQDVASDAAIPVDAYLDRHGAYSPFNDDSAASTTAADVNPKCLNRSFPGADAPNPFMPTTRPRGPT